MNKEDANKSAVGLLVRFFDDNSVFLEEIEKEESEGNWASIYLRLRNVRDNIDKVLKGMNTDNLDVLCYSCKYYGGMAMPNGRFTFKDGIKGKLCTFKDEHLVWCNRFKCAHYKAKSNPL